MRSFPRMRALTEGLSDPQALAALAEKRVRATPAQLADALDGRLAPAHRLVLRQHRDRIEFIERQRVEIDPMLTRRLGSIYRCDPALGPMPGVNLLAANLARGTRSHGRAISFARSHRLLGLALATAVTIVRTSRNPTGLRRAIALSVADRPDRPRRHPHQGYLLAGAVPSAPPSLRHAKGHLGHRPAPATSHLEALGRERGLPRTAPPPWIPNDSNAVSSD